MRHLKNKKTLDRKSAPRKALLSNLACQIILYEKIRTTEAKARVVRPIVEKIITRSKNNTLSNRRILLSRLPIKNAVKKSFEVLGPRYAERQGGYTRIIKIGQRQGDGAKLVQIELISAKGGSASGGK